MRKWIGILIFCLLVLACGSSPEQPANFYDVNISIAKEVNPYRSNSSSPVTIRVYQLSNIQKFNEAEFIDLYYDDADILSNDLLSRRVLPIYLPNATYSVKLDINKNTKFIAVLAEFANFKDSKAKAEIKLPSTNEAQININVAGLTVSTSVEEN